jgi:cytochrome c-type biogenesis protein CcmF
MNQIAYVGEHLWLGYIGHFLIILGFVTAFLSAGAYYLSFRQSTVENERTGLKLVGRYAFIAHAISMFGVIGLLFYGMYNHMYEYAYIFDHVSAELPLKYILSAFWGGQEGSFLLWIFWHAVLGLILIRREKMLEAPVLCVIAIAEVVITSMLLGIYINWGDTANKIGTNPFALIRQTMNAPIFANADYLSLIKGRGLTPLLQNYWMTIHPPTLFLGFASTLIPFAYAIAGLWQNDHKTWIHQSFKWALFSGGILGTGILMGALWAYVALTFGGYWAWDPVENASLVPWIVMVAGIHVHLIYRNTGHAAKTVYIFYLASFVLILYSTFLTRSGILGDTSAHAFTQMGLEWQLAGMVMIFSLISIISIVYRWRDIPVLEKEESLYSKEFWMFIGSLVLIFSAVLITSSTSLPVFNKIVSYFDPGYLGRVIKEPIPHYNKYQIWIGVFASLLSGFAVYMRYNGLMWKEKQSAFFVRMATHLGLSVALTYLTSWWIELPSWQFWALSIAGYYTMIANLDYIKSILKGNFKLASSAIAHLGFGMMVIGTLSSGLNQKPISSNPFVFKGLFSDEDVKKYVQLIKGKPLFSQGYFITYNSDTLIGRERFYDIHFRQVNDSLKTLDEFNLRPNALYANDFTKIAAYNPDTKHLLHKDIFTAVMKVPAAIESAEEAKNIEDSLKYTTYEFAQDKVLEDSNFVLKILRTTYNPTNKEYLKNTHESGVGISMSVYDKQDDTTYITEAAIGLQGALMYTYPAALDPLGLRIKINEQSVDQFFTPEEKLTYQEHVLKAGVPVEINGAKVTIVGFDNKPKNERYKAEEGDIAIGAKLMIAANNKTTEVMPLYIIRKNQPMSIKQYEPNSGLHLRFSNIDPAAETFTFKVAKDDKQASALKLDIARDAPRTDFIILMAAIFPGINLFWLGCILMMMGLFAAAYNHKKPKI